MSTKFEQLLDYLVNEDMEKANELFHEIVVEKSRNIYENLIAEEEADEETEMDESMEDEETEMDESVEDEEFDESMEDEEMSMEDAYTMDEEDSEEHGMDQNDPSDKLGLDTMDFGDEEGEEDHESEEDQAIYDIKNAIQELEAAFAELEKAQGAEHADMDSEFGDEEGEEDTDEEMMGMPMENRRMTREYVEKVQDGSYENSKQKSVKNAGANSGESMPLPGESKSMKWGDGKPTSNANASNIVGKTSEKTDGQHNVGTSPNKVNKGIAQEKSEQFTGTEWEKNSKAGANAGKTAFKTKVPAHGLAGNTRNNGSEGTGVGAKTGGQEAGQTGGNTNTRSIETGQRK